MYRSSNAGAVFMNSEDDVDETSGTEKVQQCSGVDENELEAAYDVFKNKQGKILTTDLPLISSSLGISLSETESEQVIKDAMDEYTEYLEHDDFKSYMEERTYEWPSHLDVLEAFRVFDHEGQGYIKTSQLKKLMQSAQLGVDENAIDCLIQDSCPDGGDDLRYEDFVQFIKEQSKDIPNT